MTQILNSIVDTSPACHAQDSGSIPRRGRFYNHRIIFLKARQRADVKYKFWYEISFFIESLVVSVLARQTRDHGSIHGQVVSFVTKKTDVKYNFCYLI